MSVYLPNSLNNFMPRRMVFSTWVDHLPFAYDIVEAIKPRCLVELGVFNGLSYFAFCQAMQELGIQGQCYAVDTWEGEEHNTVYDESVYEDVKAHNDEHYGTFSTLLRCYFNEALEQFDDGAIDLIHIDGFHTYEAVREDFKAWYPKLAPGGVMLFHDVRARIMDFGVWRFWDEVSRQYPSFTFRHGWGLGVLHKPSDEPLKHPLLQALFSRDKEQHKSLRRLYAHAARHYQLRRKTARKKRGQHVRSG